MWKSFPSYVFLSVKRIPTYHFQPTISNLPCSEVMWSNWTNRKTGNYSKGWVSWVRLFATQNKGLDSRTTAYRGIMYGIWSTEVATHYWSNSLGILRNLSNLIRVILLTTLQHWCWCSVWPNLTWSDYDRLCNTTYSTQFPRVYSWYRHVNFTCSFKTFVSRSKANFSLIFDVVTARNEVVFTRVCRSVHRGGCLPLVPGGCLPPGRQPPGRHPWADTPLRSACWNTVNKRAVRILLECILVSNILLTIFAFAFTRCEWTLSSTTWSTNATAKLSFIELWLHLNAISFPRLGKHSMEKQRHQFHRGDSEEKCTKRHRYRPHWRQGHGSMRQTRSSRSPVTW